MTVDYIKFTKEMKKSYKILAPNMLPIHFSILEDILKNKGYNIEFLEDDIKDIIDYGLKYTNNDICYPALIVIGQFIHALESGKYDKSKVAFLMSQTGGGCRASNYIHLIRKALKNSGNENIPCIGLSVANIESHPGIKFNFNTILEILYCMIYGDLIMNLYNQCKPYEVIENESDKTLEYCITIIKEKFKSKKFLNYKKNFKEIILIFNNIKRHKLIKTKVGIVGEIYMKYSRIGNNNLEKFLLGEGVEVVQSGVMDFVNYCIVNSIIDYNLYGINKTKSKLAKIIYKYIHHIQNICNELIKRYSNFNTTNDFNNNIKLVEGYIGYGVKMGEGWLLIANILDLIENGVENIVCAQPFGCLPNHIVGRGSIRKILENHPNTNIVVVDYDPSQSKVNQENRIKLMLANGKLKEYLL
ncbi:2-hydroxyacyl-CoA dehydratase [Clostridium carnis]